MKILSKYLAYTEVGIQLMPRYTINNNIGILKGIKHVNGIVIYQLPDDFNEKMFRKWNRFKKKTYLTRHCKVRWMWGTVTEHYDNDPHNFVKLLWKLKSKHGTSLKAGKIQNEVFDLTLEIMYDVLKRQNERCAVSNVRLNTQRGVGKKDPTMISVDRINSSRGYTKDNIQMVCVAINYMKMDYTQDIIADFIRKIRCPYPLKHRSARLRFNTAKRSDGVYHIHAVKSVNDKHLKLSTRIKVSTLDNWDVTKQRFIPIDEHHTRMNIRLDAIEIEYNKLSMDYHNVETIKYKLKAFIYNLDFKKNIS